MTHHFFHLYLDMRNLTIILWISKLQNKKKPNFEEVSTKVKRVIKKQRLKPEAIEESIQWARKHK